MRTEEIKKLPAGARDLASKITDAELCKHPAVARLMERLADDRAEHRAAVEALQAIRAAQEEARQRQAEVQEEIDRIQAERPGLAKAILRGEDHDGTDARLQARVADLRRVLEVYRLGLLAIEADVATAQQRIGLAADHLNDLGIALEEKSESVRADLALARWSA